MINFLQTWSKSALETDPSESVLSPILPSTSGSIWSTLKESIWSKLEESIWLTQEESIWSTLKESIWSKLEESIWSTWLWYQSCSPLTPLMVFQYYWVTMQIPAEYPNDEADDRKHPHRRNVTSHHSFSFLWLFYFYFISIASGDA